MRSAELQVAERMPLVGQIVVVGFDNNDNLRNMTSSRHMD